MSNSVWYNPNTSPWQHNTTSDHTTSTTTSWSGIKTYEYKPEEGTWDLSYTTEDTEKIHNLEKKVEALTKKVKSLAKKQNLLDRLLTKLASLVRPNFQRLIRSEEEPRAKRSSGNISTPRRNRT